jgi:hypothetical protein
MYGFPAAADAAVRIISSWIGTLTDLIRTWAMHMSIVCHDTAIRRVQDKGEGVELVCADYVKSINTVNKSKTLKLH